MDDHDDRHDQSQDVHEVVGHLENERVCDFNRAGKAPRLDAHAIVDSLVAHDGAHGY